jgi:CRP-like cAMP-binding protein
VKALERSARDKSETAEERYLRMLNEYPEIIKRVPHYDVAAYLGITAESLSRIRNKIAKGG